MKIYICGGKQWETYDMALRYANAVFNLKGIILGIELIG